MARMDFLASYRQRRWMNATRISRSRWTCRRGSSLCGRGGPHRRGGVRRLAPDAPGVRRRITLADLPAPFATRSAANRSQRAARAGADVPKAPVGFAVDQFASGLNMPASFASRRTAHLRGGNRSGARARLSPGRSQRRTGARRDLRRGFAAAVWDCFLPFGAGSALCLCRDAGLRRAVSLSQRRDESLRLRRDNREPAEQRGTLDSRPRFLSRRQDAVRFGRLRQQCRRGRAAPG
jgi:hypothetical protein